MKTTKMGSAIQGTAAQTIAKSDVSSASVKPNGAIETKQEPSTPVKILTVEDRKNRNELFGNLLKKHETYKETNQKIETFVVGSDEHSQYLQLKDSKGCLFNTGNPVLLKSVIELVRAQLSAQVGQIEDDILNFII